jgi:predicted dehydrogenase
MSLPSAGLHRRRFLELSAAGAATLAAPKAHALGATERLTVGLVGCGNRGTGLIKEVLKLKHAVAAVCDVAEFRIDRVSKLVADNGQDRPTAYADYRRLLDQKDIDAVVIATPDHHHRDQLVAAVQADKDVYVEKPLTKAIDEGREMIEAVRAARKVVQVGNQRHSGPHWRRCRDVVQSDEFGDLVWAKVWDCRTWLKRDPFGVPKGFTKEDAKRIDWDAFLGRAPKREFNPSRYWSWRWYWDYAGGLMTDIGAHQLDLVQWLSGVDAPKSVVANGGTYQFKHWETPDVVHGVWDYGPFAATFAVEFVNAADGVGAAFYGTKQTLLADAEAGGTVRVYDTVDPITAKTKPIDEWKVEAETPLHVKNWLDCCKSRKDPNSPIELGHRVITAAHLANLSYRTGRKVHWDAEREQVIGI